jgi:tripartite-type tricarboxylate transporter receptor subunit TctC
MLRREFLLGTAAAATLFTTNGIAGNGTWPERPVRTVYPYAAGSANDLAARLVSQRLGDAFGQAFIVENRLGANGTLAVETVAHAAPDGYSLFWALTPQIAISPALLPVRYDPLRDFQPISTVTASRFVLIVNAKLPIKSVGDFINYVRAQPERIPYASGSAGSIGDLTMALFLKRAALDMTRVNYKGNEPALADVIAGHVPTMFSLLGDALPHAKSGAVRMIAVSSDTRSPLAPDLPTVAESGFPGFKTGSWMGLMAPAATPPDIIERIAAQTRRIGQHADYSDRLASLGLEPLLTSPAEFATLINTDIKQWAEAIRVSGITIQ